MSSEAGKEDTPQGSGEASFTSKKDTRILRFSVPSFAGSFYTSLFQLTVSHFFPNQCPPLNRRFSLWPEVQAALQCRQSQDKILHLIFSNLSISGKGVMTLKDHIEAFRSFM